MQTSFYYLYHTKNAICLTQREGDIKLYQCNLHYLSLYLIIFS